MKVKPGKLLTDEFWKGLKLREKNLKVIVKQAKNALKKAPEGALRISKSKTTVQYYKTTKQNRYGTYIQKRDIGLAYLLAQKQYDQDVLKAAEKELRAIKHFINVCCDNGVEKQFAKLCENRKRLIHPAVLDDEEYAKEWLKQAYEQLEPYKNGYLTKKGDKVRSKSELYIADTLFNYGIPYKYEPQLYFEDGRNVYPDFICLNKRTHKEYIWEHFGMIDDYDYRNDNMIKIERYIANGYYPGDPLISTFEGSDHGLNTETVENLIQKFLL